LFWYFGTYARILFCCHGYLGQIIQPLVERGRHYLTTVMRAEGEQQRSHDGTYVAFREPERVFAYFAQLVKSR
jgi:hypothetical protein